ncbi:MAG: LPS export ABC transporter periplasmic protein LptC [Gammaproteobacteria bacterium]|jgi:lipopolysaccharide export system protein LptC
MHRHYYIVTLILLFIAIILSDKYLPTFEPLSFRPVEKEKKKASDFFLENVATTVMHANGEPDYHMTADYVTHYPDSDLVKLNKVNFRLFQTGQATLSVSANKGEVENRKSVIHLKDNVVLQRPESKTDEAITLTTSELHIFSREEYAETPAAVKVVSGNNQIEAVGMRMYLDEGRMEFLSSIRTRFDGTN